MTTAPQSLPLPERLVLLARRRLELGASFDAFAALSPSLPSATLKPALQAARTAAAAFRAALEAPTPTALDAAELAIAAALHDLDALVLLATAQHPTTLN